MHTDAVFQFEGHGVGKDSGKIGLNKGRIIVSTRAGSDRIDEESVVTIPPE
jgi:hypothetical protein